jgi:hypothetical protein
MVIITVLRITDNIISKSAVSEFSIKLKGKDDEGGDDSVVIFIIPEPFVINFILQLLSYCTLLSSLQKFISRDTAATDDFFK